MELLFIHQDNSKILFKTFFFNNYLFQYLKNGCTQYFTTPASEGKISANQKSKLHQSKGGLKDPMLDDYEDFNRLHQVMHSSIDASNYN